MAKKSKIPKWLPASESLAPFYAGVFQFVEKQLQHQPVPAWEGELDLTPSGKSVLDPLVGYIDLNPWEVALIETRLFQRLRFIKQLGLAYLVYPTLGYSRFEHTLGVLGRVEQLLSRLSRVHSQEPTKDAEVVAAIQRHEIPIRLAALFHDIGHCLFSHVSERVLSTLKGSDNYPSVDEIRSQISSHLNTRKPIPPSELLSIVMLAAPALKDFLLDMDIPEGNNKRIGSWLEQAARFITGMPLPNEAKTVFLGQMISSGLDADKLDYMTREAYFTNIPLEIDVARILDKLRVFKCQPDFLPDNLADLKSTFPESAQFLVLGLSGSAQYAFEEFCIARVTLHDKIYLHQKIRGAEAQICGYLKSLCSICEEFNELHRWLYLTESLIEHDDYPIQDQVDFGEMFRDQHATASQLNLGRIRDRALVHRSFAFGLRNSISDLPADTLTDGQTPTLGLLDVLKSQPDHFIEEVRSEVVNLATTLGIEPPGQSQLDELLLDLPVYERVQQGQHSVYLQQPPTLPRKWTLPLDQIVDYYMRYRAVGYVYAPRELCPLVNIASEKVVWRQAKLQYVQEGAIAKPILLQVDAWKQQLGELGYYDKDVQLRRPSEYLRSAAAQEKMRSCVARMLPFESFSKERVTAARLTAFIMQFPDDLQPHALSLVEHFQVITPKDIADEVVSAYNDLKDRIAGDIALVPLGSVSDSGTQVTYHLKNHEESEINLKAPFINVLNDHTVMSSEHLLFFDDNTNTGYQAVNIYAEWLAETLPDDVNLGEKHGNSLGIEARKKLRNTPVTFVFGVGPENSESTLRTLLKKHCGVEPKNVNVRIRNELVESQKLLSEKDSPFQSTKRMELRKFLEQVGEDLMTNEGKSPDVAQRRALGDGNAEALVVFPYNTPTMTITAFWCSGKAFGRDWIPLVERRRNRRADGAYAGEDA